MGARLKHVAIVSNNHRALGEFYTTLFGMRSSEGGGGAGAAVTVSDGYVGLNINARRAGRQAGLDHFGFEVDDAEAIYARVHDDYPSIEILKRPGNRPFAGLSMHDPAGNVFDLSQHGMENRGGLYVETKEQNPRHVSHIQLRAVDPSALARFYTEVLELTLQEKAPGDPNFYLTDGTLTMIIAPWKISDFAGTGIERPAMDHLGFKVESVEQLQTDLKALVARKPSLAPMSPRGYPEGEVRLKLFETCRHGSYHFADPDGVLLDVS